MILSKELLKGGSKTVFAGLDIGTSKIAVVIGEGAVSGGLNILGVGMSRSRGLRQGVVINLDQAVQSIQKAMHAAQLTAGAEVRDVIVGIAGDHVRGVNSKGVVGIAGPDHEIGKHDVERVIDAAKAIALPFDREVLHVLPQEFVVDNQHGIKNAVGMTGVRLEAEVHIVTGAVTSAQNIVRCVKKAGLRVTGLVLEPLASSYAVLDQNEKEMGAALIDIGEGTTDLAIFYDGAIRYTGVVGLAGRNVTNDIAVGLRTPIEKAEEIKIKHGCAHRDAVDEVIPFQVASMGGRDSREFMQEDLVDIIQPRMEEIFSLVAKEIKNCEYGQSLAAGITLTGGGALLKGTELLAEEVFGIPAKLGIPMGISGLVETVESPMTATGVGLLKYHMEKGDIPSHDYGEDEAGMFTKVYQWMKSIVEDFI